MSDIKHQDAINKATLLIDNGYSASYIYEKLLKEGFSEEEAKSVLESLTDKPLVSPILSKGASPMPAEPKAKSPEPDDRKARINRQALKLFQEGADNDRIFSILTRSGFSKTEALDALHDLPKNSSSYSRNYQVQGNDAMIQVGIGFVIMAIGCGVTFFTFRDAVNAGGGTYTIAWGAIIVGGIRVFTGLMSLK